MHDGANDDEGDQFANGKETSGLGSQTFGTTAWKVDAHKQDELGRGIPDRGTVSTAVLEDLGKSDTPDGSTDVTGWGVTTAEMATLPSGVAPTE